MRCSTRRLERLTLLLALLLAGCAATDASPRLAIERAARDGDALRLALRYQPSATQLRALDEGVPLALTVHVEEAAHAPVQFQLHLRYFPLSRRYQLHVNGIDDASFALRGYLFAALENLRLPLPPGMCAKPDRCRIEVRQNVAALPGALRLPALLHAAWRVPVAIAGVGGATP